MKTQILAIAVLASSLAFTSCSKEKICVRGSGALVTQTLELPPLAGVELAISGDIHIYKGEKQEVTITAQQNIIDQLDNEIRNDIWIVDFKKNCVSYKKDVTINITVPDLHTLDLSGSGSIIMEDYFDSLAVLNTSVTGSGDVFIRANSTSMSTKVSGSGDIAMHGSANEHTIKISGSGEVHAYELETQFTNISITGSGNCEVTCYQELDVNISGSGDVYYKGDPKVTQTITGSGRVVDAN